MENLCNSLPDGFPMYCRDLKQMMDEKQERIKRMGTNAPHTLASQWGYCYAIPKDGGVGYLDVKNHPNYPKQTNEHNALADARWNRELHQFIKTL